MLVYVEILRDSRVGDVLEYSNEALGLGCWLMMLADSSQSHRECVS